MSLSCRCAGSLELLGQQFVGLRNGGQRIADLVRHRGRHAAHGGQLLGAQPGFHLAQVLHEHHAQAVAARLLRGREAGAREHLPRRRRGQLDGDVGHLRLPLEKVRRAMSTSGSQAGCAASCRAPAAGAPSSSRAAGLAAWTWPSGSTTSTPSARVSITSWLTSTCIDAALRLARAASSSRASRSASWWTRKASAK
jgi:hypothetical protein